MKRFICWLFGHKLEPYKGDFLDPYCVRCGKHISIIQIFKDASK